MKTAFSRILSVIRLLAYKCICTLVDKVKQMIQQRVSKGGDNMTQNQIAYWANVERERSNRRNEEISAAAQRSKEQLERAQEASAKASETKSLHDVVTNYMDKSGFKTAVGKIAAGEVAAKALGLDPIALTGLKNIQEQATDQIATVVDTATKPVEKLGDKIDHALGGEGQPKANTKNKTLNKVIDTVNRVNKVVNTVTHPVSTAIGSAVGAIVDKVKKAKAQKKKK